MKGNKRCCVVVGVEHDGQIDLSTLHPMFDLHVIGLADGNFDVGILLMELLQNGGEPVPDHIVVCGDMDGTRHGVFQP
ncbi:Uncharacterised protein [uncultured Blautia sp.]|nr:Uncharacterised protein [uncultured Blautia sp.]